MVRPKKTKATKSTAKTARGTVAEKLQTVAGKLPDLLPGDFLTFQQTEAEIIGLVERLHDLRIASKPDIFQRLWIAHIGRLEEIEAHDEPYEMTPMGHLVDAAGIIIDSAKDVGHVAADENISTVAAGKKRAVEIDEEMDEEMDEDAAMFEGHASSSKTTIAKDSQIAKDFQLAQDFQLAEDAAAFAFPVNTLSEEQLQKRRNPNFSAEPFNSTGNPMPASMTQMHNIPVRMAGAMSVYIMSSHPRSPYTNRAWHLPDAPVDEQHQVKFFTQILARIDHVADKDVKGYALSYGWCDVSRWVRKTAGMGCRGWGNGENAGESEGERQGWEVFQRDLREAAHKGVMVWRLKVLVVTE